MNMEKAREYFSDYYEGTLAEGLKETFERALRSDAQVQAEYRSFEKLMKEMDLLGAEVPEPEFDLHEVIARRLDKHIFEEKRKAPGMRFAWWKSIALGGIATVALAAAVFQLKSIGTPTAGVITPASEKLEIKSTSAGYRLQYSTSGDRELAVRLANGTELLRRRIHAANFSGELANPNPKASLLEIEIVGEKDLTFVAMPGTKFEPAAKGEGDLKSFALALAGFYRQPVAFNMGQEVGLKWSLSPGDALGPASKTMEGTQYSVQKTTEGVLWIRPN